MLWVFRAISLIKGIYDFIKYVLGFKKVKQAKTINQQKKEVEDNKYEYETEKEIDKKIAVDKELEKLDDKEWIEEWKNKKKF